MLTVVANPKGTNQPPSEDRPCIVFSSRRIMAYPYRKGINTGFPMLSDHMEANMADKVFKKFTVVGCSSESYQKAVEIGLSKAADSLHGLAWFEVKEMRGGIGSDGKIEWQASIEVAFKLD